VEIFRAKTDLSSEEEPEDIPEEIEVQVEAVVDVTEAEKDAADKEAESSIAETSQEAKEDTNPVGVVAKHDTENEVEAASPEPLADVLGNSCDPRMENEEAKNETIQENIKIVETDNENMKVSLEKINVEKETNEEQAQEKVEVKKEEGKCEDRQDKDAERLEEETKNLSTESSRTENVPSDPSGDCGLAAIVDNQDGADLLARQEVDEAISAQKAGAGENEIVSTAQLIKNFSEVDLKENVEASITTTSLESEPVKALAEGEQETEEEEEDEVRPTVGIHVISNNQFEAASQPPEDQPRIVNGRKVIEVTKQFHEISMSDSESDLNTTNEDVEADDVR
jgi:hypothetical protein